MLIMILAEVMMNVENYRTFETLDILMARACLHEQITDSNP